MGFKRSFEPKIDPILAPIKAIGPSMPAFPPLPIVMLETKIFVRQTLPLNFPPFNAIDSNKTGIPEPLVSGAILEIMGPTINAQITGRNNKLRL